MSSTLVTRHAWRDDPDAHGAQPATNPGASRPSPSNSHVGCRAQPVSRYVESEKDRDYARLGWPRAAANPSRLTRSSWGDWSARAVPGPWEALIGPHERFLAAGVVRSSLHPRDRRRTTPPAPRGPLPAGTGSHRRAPRLERRGTRSSRVAPPRRARARSARRR